MGSLTILVYRYVHSYQSYLWNHAASVRVQKYGADGVVVGDLVYCKDNSGEEAIPIPAECEVDTLSEADGVGNLGEVLEPTHVHSQEPSSVLTDQSAPTASWSFGSMPAFDSSNVGRDDAVFPVNSMVNCCSSSSESAGGWPAARLQNQIDEAERMRGERYLGQVCIDI